MNLAEEFMQGRIACEVGDCTQTATVSVKDLGHVFGQGPVAAELVQIGPIHFFCDLHKREPHSFKQSHGEWVRF